MSWTPLVCILVLNGGEPATRPAYLIRAEFARRIEAVCTRDVRAPQAKAQEWLVAAARIPEMPGRQIKVSTTMSPQAADAVELSAEKRPILFARFPVRTRKFEQALSIRVTSRADLLSRHLLPLEPGVRPPPVAPLSARERQTYLASTATLNFGDKAFQSWLDGKGLRRREREGDVDLGRRVFLAVTRNMSYELLAKMDRRAAQVCQAGKSDCGGLAAVFVAALRANGVPARLVVGRWALSAKPGATVGGLPFQQQHVKAEFYAAGVGWVPADLSSAVLHDQNPPGGLRYFGHDDGDFLVMHFDDDLIVDTVYFGRETVSVLQGPQWWLSGSGRLDGATTTDDWQVRVLKP
jgi:hypothetical protein